jgi:hypothetical protein
LENILNRVGEYEKNGKGYMARCPAHNDKNPSLSICEGEGGQVLIHCFAGCETKDVLSAVGLNYSDLYPDGASSNGYGKETKYEIKDVAGNLIATHHRIDTPKGKHMWWTDAEGNKSLPVPVEQHLAHGLAEVALHKDVVGEHQYEIHQSRETFQ